MKNLYRAEHKKWDAYKAFHSTSWPFVDFESGHVSLGSDRYSPVSVRLRETYPAREVAIVDTTGRGYSGRIVYKDPATGAVVPAAQLSYEGIATFLIDLKTGRAYSTIGDPPKGTTAPEPHNFYSATIVMNPDGTVVPTQGILYYPPRKLSAGEKETLLQLVTMCKILDGSTQVATWVCPTISSLSENVAVLYEGLSLSERAAIAAGRYEIARLPTTVPYLNVEVS